MPFAKRFAFLALVLLSSVWFVFADSPPRLPKDTLPPTSDIKTIPEGLDANRPIPANNPLSIEKVDLGRKLFFDPILSKDKTVSCASCHDPEKGFATSHKVAVGIGGKKGTRNAPTLFNVVYGKSFFWDGRVRSLEEQALLPIINPRELGSSHEEVVRRLRADVDYVRQFRKVFNKAITIDLVGKAIASFERTLLLGDSPIDKFHAAKNTALLTKAERQGLWLFESRGRCWRCHQGPNFSDNTFHNTGVSWGKQPIDLGRFHFTKRDKDRGAFKTPTLRGLTLTAPYMHDGSIKSLKKVVQFYNKGGVRNPYLDKEMQPLKLSPDDIENLVAFLKALSK